MINNKEILLFLEEAKEQDIIKSNSDKILNQIIELLEKTERNEIQLEVLIRKLVQELKIEYFNLGVIYNEIKIENSEKEEK